MENEMTEDRKALENLVIDNPDLERLEALLDEFNIFEVLGAVRVELRHSEFLAFLMNPQQNHGLGDAFVKKFLQKAIVGIDPGQLPVNAIDLDVWSLDDLTVSREWRNIDILLISEEHQFVVVIENKIGSREHSNQLQRYREIVEETYPDWHKLYLFLTPEGTIPGDDNYLPVPYDLIVDLLERFADTRKASLGPDVLTLINHYTSMLRRNIVSGSETVELARKIYKKHQRALDLIFEHKPDLQADIKDLIEQLIEKSSQVELEYSQKNIVGFGIPEWHVPVVMQSVGWGNVKQLLLFEFKNSQSNLRLKLYIGPGPIDIRQKMLDTAHANKPPFHSQYKNLNKKWNDIYTFNILKEKDYKDAAIEDLEEKITTKWEEFLSGDFLELKKMIMDQEWFEMK